MNSMALVAIKGLTLAWVGDARCERFGVKDKKVLDKLSADKKVEFELVQQGSDYVITTVK